MSKQIVELVTRWSAYEEKHSNPDIVAFCRLVISGETIKEKKITDRAEKIGQLARIIGRLSSVYGLYHRSAMLNNGLPANDSFFFLNVLNQLGEVNKSDLINYLLAETTTGMEAINKLVNAGLVKERKDN
ncbi:MAG: winged helix DNA-binding protein, partial [Chryseolinea sp.]